MRTRTQTKRHWALDRAAADTRDELERGGPLPVTATLWDPHVLALPHRLATRPLAGPAVLVNELDYDNSGTDTGEAVGLAGPVGADLTGWAPVACNGATGTAYDTRPLGGTLPDQQAGFGTLAVDYPTNGLQNGSPDGLALVDPAGLVVQFVSYEGTFTALGGLADGAPSVDIGRRQARSTAGRDH